jgi:hypothetical protein
MTSVSELEMRARLPISRCSTTCCRQLTTFGCHPKRERNVLVKPAEQDRCVPDDFYSTTNHRTHVRLKGKWIEVEKQRMDAVIVATGGQAECRKLRDVKVGDPIVCGHDGIRVTPEFRERDRLGFAFMNNDVSSERRVEGSVARIALMMREVKKTGGRIVVVAARSWFIPEAWSISRSSSGSASSMSCSRATRSPSMTSNSRCRAPRSALTWLPARP